MLCMFTSYFCGNQRAVLVFRKVCTRYTHMHVIHTTYIHTMRLLMYIRTYVHTYSTCVHSCMIEDVYNIQTDTYLGTYVLMYRILYLYSCDIL